MKLFLATFLAFIGTVNTTNAKITDYIPSSISATTAGFVRSRTEEQKELQKTDVSMVAKGSTFILQVIDAAVLPLEFANYAIAVAILSLNRTTGDAIRIINSE